MIIIVCIAGALGILFLVIQYGFLVPATRGLPILMYHKVSQTKCDDLTITAAMLEKQLRHLVDNGYISISIRQLLKAMESDAALPKKPVLITFDDAYESHATIVAPLLKRLSCKGVFFATSRSIGGTNSWDRGGDRILSANQLKSLDGNVVEIGLHSAGHRNFASMIAEQIESDIGECISQLREINIPFVPVFSYPYGGRPKDAAVYQRMVAAFQAAGIKLAFRIGNRVNKLPLRNRFEVKRIDIKGTDSMWTFAAKLQKGRVRQL
jgi:peptidoglycan/xylan/chitin deacetylase (PgdA/CDA1 family)